MFSWLDKKIDERIEYNLIYERITNLEVNFETILRKFDSVSDIIYSVNKDIVDLRNKIKILNLEFDEFQSIEEKMKEYQESLKKEAKALTKAIKKAEKQKSNK